MPTTQRIVTLDEFNADHEGMVKEVQDERRELLIVDAGVFVARLQPIETSQYEELTTAHDLEIMRGIDRIAEQYDHLVPAATSSVELIAEQRRD